MTHAEKIAAAEREVRQAARLAVTGAATFGDVYNAMSRADELVAEACGLCGGTGIALRDDIEWDPCPAGCDSGRVR